MDINDRVASTGQFTEEQGLVVRIHWCTPGSGDLDLSSAFARWLKVHLCGLRGQSHLQEAIVPIWGILRFVRLCWNPSKHRVRTRGFWAE